MRITKKPWGCFKQFSLNENSTVKILELSPHQSLSLQYHKKREEEWYFITEGFVQIGIHKRKVKKGEVVKIKKAQAHRLIAGKKKLVVLEISYGKFDEKDIIRMEDKYGRS